MLTFDKRYFFKYSKNTLLDEFNNEHKVFTTELAMVAHSVAGTLIATYCLYQTRRSAGFLLPFFGNNACPSGGILNQNKGKYDETFTQSYNYSSFTRFSFFFFCGYP
jgi:hypothetical protein